MDLSLFCLWLTCSLSVAVFAAGLPIRISTGVAFVAALLMIAMWIGPNRVASIPVVGVVAFAAALWHLVRPMRPLPAAIVAGGLGGVWIGALMAQGVPRVAAGVIAIAFAGVIALVASRRRQFAPPALIEEALLFVAVLSLVTAAVPGMVDGWRAAVGLSVQSASPAAAIAIPGWTLALTTMAVASGGCYSLWRRW